MKVTTVKTVWAEDLREAVNTQFGCEIENIANLLFPEDYMNDCYKSYNFEVDDEYHGYDWEDEERIRLTNLVNAYLRDVFPGEKRILIDVSW